MHIGIKDHSQNQPSILKNSWKSLFLNTLTDRLTDNKLYAYGILIGTGNFNQITLRTDGWSEGQMCFIIKKLRLQKFDNFRS